MVEFLISYWKDILIITTFIIFLVLPIFPPELSGRTKQYFDLYQKKMVDNHKVCFIQLVTGIIFHIILMDAIISIGFRGTVTLVLFVLLGADLLLNKTITKNAVTISIIGIIALYLDKFLDSADEIEIWKIFKWKSKSQKVTNKN